MSVQFFKSIFLFPVSQSMTSSCVNLMKIIWTTTFKAACISSAAWKSFVWRWKWNHCVHHTHLKLFKTTAGRKPTPPQFICDQVHGPGQVKCTSLIQHRLMNMDAQQNIPSKSRPDRWSAHVEAFHKRSDYPVGIIPQARGSYSVLRWLGNAGPDRSSHPQSKLHSAGSELFVTLMVFITFIKKKNHSARGQPENKGLTQCPYFTNKCLKSIIFSI